MTIAKRLNGFGKPFRALAALGFTGGDGVRIFDSRNHASFLSPMSSIPPVIRVNASRE
jgi:hypothetical protein